MKKILFLMAVSLLLSCSLTRKTGSHQKKPQVQLILDKMPEDFVWKKHTYLNLTGKIVNNSKEPITILAPRVHTDEIPDYFEVRFSNDFTSFFGEIEVEDVLVDQIIRKARDFFTIQPNQSLPILISGKAYHLLYSPNEESEDTLREVQVRIQYIGPKEHFTKDSYYIRKGYKCELNDSDKKYIASIMKSYETYLKGENLSEEEIKKKLNAYKQRVMKSMMPHTREEQQKMIKKFNSLYREAIVSNTISIKIEK